MKNVRTHLAAQITDKTSARAWIRDLVKHDMSFHLEDNPSEIIRGATNEPLFTREECRVVRKRVAALYDMKWNKREGGCPIGYMMQAEGIEVGAS